MKNIQKTFMWTAAIKFEENRTEEFQFISSESGINENLLETLHDAVRCDYNFKNSMSDSNFVALTTSRHFVDDPNFEDVGQAAEVHSMGLEKIEIVGIRLSSGPYFGSACFYGSVKDSVSINDSVLVFDKQRVAQLSGID